MALEPWDPFQEMLSLHDAMNQLFQDSFIRSGKPSGSAGQGGLALDIAESENAYEVHAAMPGVKPEDIQITIQGDTLTIHGQTSTQQEQQGKNWITREQRSGSFLRTVTLPTAVNPDQAEARFENGMLVLTLPKAESAKPRQIPVTGSSQAQQLSGAAGQTTGASSQPQGNESQEPPANASEQSGEPQWSAEAPPSEQSSENASV